MPTYNRRHHPKIDPAAPPPRVDRKTAAELLLARFGLQVSPRTLEIWPLATQRLNGRAMIQTAELLAYAEGLVNAAPTVRCGKRAA